MSKQKTLAVREAVAASQYRENSEALFLTSSFCATSAAQAQRLFANDEEGYIYSRFSNPTVDSFQRRLAKLENGEACIATASGMSAILLTALGLLQSGDHVVCANEVFGATIRLFGEVLARYQIETTFVNVTDLDGWRRAMRSETKLFFLESPSNPLGQVGSLAEIGAIAREGGARLVVDNCFCSPALQQPLNMGAHLVVHSATKLIDGQGRVLGGAVVCDEETIVEKLFPMQRSVGLSMSPFNAWVCLKGCETLDLRVRAQSQAALEIAQWLSEHPKVSSVHYTGLASHPQHDLAMRQQSGLGGPLLSFTAKCSVGETRQDAAWRIIDNTELCSITANLGDTKTTITHPATTSHGRLSDAQREDAGIGRDLVRLSVGLEDVDDLKADLDRGLQLA